MTHITSLNILKETKGTIVYEHPDPGRDGPDKLYVPKFLINKDEEPKQLTVLLTSEFTPVELNLIIARALAERTEKENTYDEQNH